ncbi:DUF309 domain-containing protein [Streptomyces sp. SHP 1-2]|uniref:DUF309 domain-containing protein n=1 Tax=Streptomyces sp. SHP 1-2 TaxID=2769489 RepID=UPI002237D30E|nr:DUF309 domain-containing protein [Streptomyces sp. SHP 1-2]MCW5253495.1 DUF309 domain-containing protein [Streptomyces sp. SHP 1-2]
MDSPSDLPRDAGGVPPRPVAARERDARDRDEQGRARNARPRDGLGRPLPYGAPGVERQPEGVVRTPDETVGEAQRLLDGGRPFHAHEVFEDAWKSGPAGERELWRGMAQLAVGLTHAARGNAVGGARLLRRGATAVTRWTASATGRERPYGLDVAGLTYWARELAEEVDEGAAVDAGARAPRLRG